MFKLRLASRSGSPREILCLGAHCDDIELGCGGTILKLTQRYPDIHIHWIVFSSSSKREGEARKSADLFLAAVGVKNIVVKNFRNGFFPYIGREIKEYFEQLNTMVNPDVIFTHYRNDLHQDHRIVSELTWNTFRDHFILEYEIVKYDGDIGSPNCFNNLSLELVGKKIETLFNCFETQKAKPWFSEESFRSILRLRGVESNSPSGYAEAFYCRKAALEL